jgi:hypothetical protein
MDAMEKRIIPHLQLGDVGRQRGFDHFDQVGHPTFDGWFACILNGQRNFRGRFGRTPVLVRRAFDAFLVAYGPTIAALEGFTQPDLPFENHKQMRWMTWWWMIWLHCYSRQSCAIEYWLHICCFPLGTYTKIDARPNNTFLLQESQSRTLVKLVRTKSCGRWTWWLKMASACLLMETGSAESMW